jgi:hypothetical protein
MTNEERSALIAQSWTPPKVVDPDLAEAKKVVNEFAESYDWTPESLAIRAIKRGRALAAEAKPGMFWVKHDGSEESPVNKNWFVAICRRGEVDAGRARLVDWRVITHYAIIPHPAEDVA